MTPPAAAAAPVRTRTRRVTPPPRRVSGPARPRSAASAPPPLALRLGGAVRSVGLAEHHLLDRLVRGRAWIAILAIGLMGIVFMQVSMLRMNAGISTAVEAASTLERRNAALRATISELSSGDRIAAEASRLGLVVPAITARFLDARSVDARRAAERISPPGQNVVPSTALAADEPPVATEAPVLQPAGVAPQTQPATATSDAAPAAPATATSGAAPATATSDAAPATGDPHAPAPEPAAAAAAPAPHADAPGTAR